MSVIELEKLRKSIRNFFLLGILISLLVGLTICFIGQPIPGVILMMLGIVVVIAIFIFRKGKFTYEFKQAFVLKPFQDIFTDLEYNPELGISSAVIESTNMLSMGNKYSSNDYISGKYKNVEFKQADVCIKEESQSIDTDGAYRTSITLFKGKWMIFDFNKKFRSNIQVRQKGFSNAYVNNWGQSKEYKYKKIEMENVEFNNKFRVYGQSQHETFYILTPSMMERIISLTSKIKGKVLFCFIDNCLHVGILNNSDSFEHNIFMKIKEEKIINEVSNEIKLIVSFIEELNLDNTLFKK